MIAVWTVCAVLGVLVYLFLVRPLLLAAGLVSGP